LGRGDCSLRLIYLPHSVSLVFFVPWWFDKKCVKSESPSKVGLTHA
jgi:hypothetical protein